MKMLNMLLTAGILTAAAAPAAELTWGELARRPELWPAQCTCTKTVNFQGGLSVPGGQKLIVLEIKADEADVCTLDRKTTFVAAPDETDVLEVARVAYDALTPKQRELTYNSLVQRKDLWPHSVTLQQTFNLGGGRALVRGEKMRVLAVSPGSLLLLDENLNASFNIVPGATDIMAQARRFVEDPQAGPRFAVLEQQAQQKAAASGPVIAELEGKLVNSVTDRPEPLDAAALPRYIVFYRGSSTCPYTRGFTPTLIKYYQEMKPLHPEFEIIYVMTEPAADTGKFAKKMGFSWRAVSYESTATMPTMARAIGSLLPQLLVMDRRGDVLVNGMQTEVMAALRQFDALLRKPPVAN